MFDKKKRMKRIKEVEDNQVTNSKVVNSPRFGKYLKKKNI